MTRRSLSSLALSPALALVVAAPLSAQLPRLPGEVFETGAEPGASGNLVLFDVQPDGILDVLVHTLDGLVLLTGAMDGRLVDPVVVDGSSSPPRFALADVDQDGSTDVVVLTQNAVTVLERDGLGGLQQQQWQSLNGFGVLSVMTDLDGDGDPDLAGAGGGSPGVTVWINDGSGQLVKGATNALGSCQQLTHGDVDGDGDQDLVATVVDFSQGGFVLETWVNDGAGGFSLLGDAPIGSGLRVQLHDLDGDGDLDAIAPYDAGPAGGYRVLPGDGTGVFGPMVTVPVSDGVDFLLADDVDGDGILDLLGADLGQDDEPDENVSLLRGVGGGALLPEVFWSLGLSPIQFAVGDLDGLGLPDLVVSIPGLAGVAVLLGEQDGGPFADPLYQRFGQDIRAEALTVDDVDHDGDPDLVLLGSLGLVTLLGDGGSGWDVSEPHPVGLLPSGPAFGDLDGDGDLDAVAAIPFNDKVMVRLGDGAGGWTNTNAVLLPSGTEDVALGDMDGDGRLDLLAGSAPIVVARGLGNGLFAPAQAAPGGSGGRLALGDADADGQLDVLAGSQVVELHLGDGLGGLAAPVASDLGLGLPSITHVELVDLDGDADLDVLVASHELPGVVTMLNDGSATFGVPQSSLLVEEGIWRLAHGDVTGDGLPDVVARDHQDGLVSVAEGLGDGTFGAPRRFLARGDARGLAVGDVDGDLRQDVVLTTYYEPEALVVLRHPGPEPTWASVPGAVPGSGPELALTGSGTLLAVSPTRLDLTGGEAFAVSTLVVGFTELSAPFKGGVLVPFPDLLLSWPLDGSGAATLQAPWPAGVPSATALFWQVWSPDPGAPVGLAASPGLRTLTP